MQRVWSFQMKPENPEKREQTIRFLRQDYGLSIQEAVAVLHGRDVKKQVDEICSWVDCKLVLQQIIKDIYPADPESGT